tara:strand:+ start:219 stop:671 length:453 start_codon:yes stop_codon:yes gene_type:complete
MTTLQKVGRDKVLALEKAMLEQPQIEIVAVEYFCGGVYAREITIPKGTALVGEIHLKDQINVVSKGSIKVVTEDGEKIIRAPSTFISKAGVKRAGYAITDTVWTEFIATELTNEDDIRQEFIAPDYEAFDKQLEKQHGLGSHSDSGINSI